MKNKIDLANCEWVLSGYWPESWEWDYSMETGAAILPEIDSIPASVPGSVQLSLQRAELLPDWNFGLNARACEWVENRAWIYRTKLPIERLGKGLKVVACFEGLDGNGVVLANGKRVGTFDNAFVPHRFDLTDEIGNSTELRLEIVFEPPPRWLGQITRTSQIKDWKPRFNYSWDWTSRLVQIGIWDEAFLEVSDGVAMQEIMCLSVYDAISKEGRLELSGNISPSSGEQHIELTVTDGKGNLLLKSSYEAEEFAQGVRLEKLAVEPWWPNGLGAQSLYQVAIERVDKFGKVLETVTRRVGFRSIEWQKCQGAPVEADPWICVVNGTPVFLQGVNWTPLRPNFADCTVQDYLRILDLYRAAGCNILRVWGGAVLEKEAFYQACDERGLMVWQEFPLSSSGIENWPPEDPKSIDQISAIAVSYIKRRRHHASLILWCGGNELQGALDGSKTGIGKPVDVTHPLLKRLADTVSKWDPTRRFLPTSASGPRFTAEAGEFGKGLHWDIHGPWKIVGGEMKAHTEYWKNDDSLFRSEAGSPGASSASIILRYAGDAASPFPASLENPLWRRTSWWFDWPQFKNERGRDPATLQDYVDWSQQRQAEGLVIAASASKRRFPECGGFIIWMGHDSFPCTCNTSIIDFEGNPKPALLALKEVFQKTPEQLRARVSP
jgi:beta-mannosidase